MALCTDGLIEVTFQGTLQGVEWANIFHYWNTTNAPVVDLDEIPALFDSAWANRIAVVSGDGVTFSGITARDVFGLSPDAFAVPADTTGNLAEQALPALNAVRIDLGVGDKSTRKGYKRVVGVTEPQTDAGFLVSAALTAWNTEAQNALNQLVTTNAAYFPVVYGGATDKDAFRSQANIILTATARGRVTSQVSRKGSN